MMFQPGLTMKTVQLLRRGLAAVALLSVCASPALAEDIDIFAAGQGGEGGVANILLVLDNSANFSANVRELRCSIDPVTGAVDITGNGSHPTALDGSAAAVEQCALYNALKKIQADAALPGNTGAKFNLAVMGFNANGLKTYNPVTNAFTDECVGGTGGCLLMRFARFDGTNATNILNWIRLWNSTSGNTNVKGNNAANGAVFQEAWAYLNGRTGVSGRNYTNVAPPAQCGGKSIIFVGNAYRNNATPGDGTNEASSPRLPLLGLSATALKNASPAATAIQREVITDSIRTRCSTANQVLETAEGKGAYALNWAAYLRGQGVTTFSIGVLGPTCNAEYAAHLTKLGSLEVGGGGFFPSNDFAELTAAFSTAINQILAVNTAFASVSLPVSVNTQGAFLNQVFVGQFRPNESFLPRWNGNLKQYRMGVSDDNSLRLVDADGTPAINSLTGFISECARAYWTPTTLNDYWAKFAQGECSLASKVSDSPDGNIVEKGAHAFVLRSLSPGDRNVLTCSASGTGCTSLKGFLGNDTALQTAVGSEQMINWSRGRNLGFSNINELDKSADGMRPSVHGDVVHSRPVAVNYGTDTSPNIVVFYGANDGMLRAINGNQTSSSTYGTRNFAPGSELWAFMPPEFYGRIRRLYENTVAVRLPPPADNTGRQPKDYGMDGPITAFSGQVGGDPKKFIYATMRRGGRVVYAFDVTAPENPTLAWRRGCPNLTDDTDCSPGFEQIGQTWSSVKTLTATGYGSGTAPLVVMGGGYDNCEDTDSATTAAGITTYRNHSCTTTSKGNRIYVMDAANGTLVRSFTTDRPVVADLTIVNGPDGRALYAYAADMGGNVYRVSFTGTSPTAWSIRKIAALGCDAPGLTGCSTATAPRKFMFAPGVVTADSGTTYNILLGSGDREKPVRTYLATQSVQNYFFMLRDRPGDTGWFDSEATVTGCGVTNSLLCLNSLTPITPGVKPTDAALSAKKGWYLALSSTEQVVTSALTLFGVTTFSTSQPPVVSTTTCAANLGTTRVYNINYLNAFSATNEALPYATVVGGGLPPSPVGGLVLLGPNNLVPFCIGCSAASPLESRRAGSLSNVTKPIGRSYWYLKQ